MRLCTPPPSTWRSPKDVLLGSSQETCLASFTLSLYSKAMVILEVCLESLSCWNIALRPGFWREGIILGCSISQYILEFMFPSIKYNSPTPAALMQSQTMSFPPLCLTVGMTHLSLYYSPGCRHTMLWIDQNQTNWSLSHQIIGHGSSNPCVLLTCLLKLVWRHSCVSSSEEASSCGVQCMVWALTGRPPHLFNLCHNTDRTPTPIFQRNHLDVMLSTCAQLLWTIYSRPVLSGPSSFKTLDDLSHCAAAQFQGVGNLPVALAIFM